MFVRSSAAALVLSFFAFNVSAQDAPDVDSTCPYKPVWNTCQGTNPSTKPKAPKYSDFECATIRVTKDYTEPTGTDNEMELNLIRFPAGDDYYKDAESIIVNFGGPGESGIQGLLEQGSDLSDQVDNKLHIVSFDPRGVGINNPYDCNPTTRFPTDKDYSTQAKVSKIYDAAVARAKECEIQNPEKGLQVGTIAVAKDVRQIAFAVGQKDKLIRYWGFSYGTVLGDTIARLFPTKIGGMVLDGNINPNDYWLKFPVEEAANVDAATKNFFKLCADAKTACAWNDGGDSSYQTLLNKYDGWVGATAGVRGTSAVTLDIQKSYYVRDFMSEGVKFGSRFIKAANVIQSWYEDAEKITDEDFDSVTDPAATVEKRQASTDSEGNFTPNQSNKKNRQALTAITGSDNGFREATAENYFEWLQSYNEKSKYSGDVSIQNLWKYAPWVPRAAEVFNTEFANIQTSPRPIVFVQTPFDPVTPSDSGLAAHAVFTNSVYVTTQGVGHCSGSHESKDLEKAVGDYWTSSFVPPNNKNYDLTPDTINPFVEKPSDVNNNDENNNTDLNSDEDNNADSAADKRDLSELFKGIRFIHKRAGDPEDLTCEDTNSTTSTTSTTTTSGLYNNGTSTRTSTQTGSVSTTTSGSSSSKTTASAAPGKSSTWNQWLTSSTKRTSTYPKETEAWGQWSTKSTASSTRQQNPATSTWQNWDDGSARVTKYVYTVVDVCSTGLTTSTITVTASCDKSKGCGDKPAVPTGYKTTEIYCSACSVPSKVTVTVKVTETAKWSTWTDASGLKTTTSSIWNNWNADPSSVKATGTASWSTWADGNVASIKATGVTTGSASWVDWASASASPSTKASGTSTGLDEWNNWGSATSSGLIAKYTGGANTDAVMQGGLYVAVAAIAFVL